MLWYRFQRLVCCRSSCPASSLSRRLFSRGEGDRSAGWRFGSRSRAIRLRFGLDWLRALLSLRWAGHLLADIQSIQIHEVNTLIEQLHQHETLGSIQRAPFCSSWSLQRLPHPMRLNQPRRRSLTSSGLAVSGLLLKSWPDHLVLVLCYPSWPSDSSARPIGSLAFTPASSLSCSFHDQVLQEVMQKGLLQSRNHLLMQNWHSTLFYWSSLHWPEYQFEFDNLTPYCLRRPICHLTTI